MPHQVVGLCGGLCIALVQSEPKEETVFVSLSLWGCRHSCNWNALHVADWRDNLLAMCFSHSHVMRLGSGCRDFIYILVKKKKKKKGKRKGTCQEKIGKLSWCMNRRAGQGRFIRGSYCIGERRVPRAGQCVRRGHSFGTHGTLKHGITAVTTINFGMGSVGIMTYSWRTSSYWPDRQYWFIEETPMLSWQPEVMVGGNRAGDEEGCSLSSELYCCYRFPIRKRDGPLYWPTTSHESPPQSHRPAEAIFPRCISEQMWYSAVTLLCVCVCVCVPGLSYHSVFMMIRCMPLFSPATTFVRSCRFFVVTGSCARWPRLLKEAHRVQWSCVLANADRSYGRSPRSSTPLW